MSKMRGWLFFGDFVRLHILYQAAKKPISCVEVVTRLDRHGYRLRPGKVYSVLHALERAGYLTGCSVVVSGKRRKHYEATGKGRQVVELAKAKLHALAAQVLQPFHYLGESRSGKQRTRCLEEF